MRDSIDLRPATNEDSIFVWRLRNSPEVRAVSFSQEPIRLMDHEGYFRSRLSEFQIILLEGSEAGYLRLVNQEVSIALDEAVRGRGVGSAVLKRLSPGCTALILGENEASLKAFKKAGFSIQMVYYAKKVTP